MRRPGAEELARFEAAGRTNPTVDMGRVAQARIATGPYRVMSGDVLRLEMPRFLEQQPIAAGTDSRQTYNCRVGDDGAIVLPMIGALVVRGRSLAEIESAIVAAYYPKYVAAPLPVYVSILEHVTGRVSVIGAVTQPGIHALRRDQMSLVGLLMQAGGIVGQGAAVIRITRGENGDAAAPAAPVPPIVAPAPSPVVRAVFEREGPLRTTGWLRVEDETGWVSAREWLDLGSEPQRREFLAALQSQDPGPDGRGRKRGHSTFSSENPEPAAREEGKSSMSPFPPLDELGTKLAQLGVYLERVPNARNPLPSSGLLAFSRADLLGSRSSPPPGWRILDNGCFTTAVAEPPQAAGKDERGSPRAVTQTQTLVLPVRGLSIPFADVVLEEGDAVVVEPPREQSISVLGLVARPGLVPYPPGAQYTLIQAIALAGGLDLVANPRYVNVYRLDPEGEVVSATFQLVRPRRQPQLTEALSLPLRPGDVVSVEHTLRTRTNVFFDRVFRVNLGLYASPESLWND